MVLFGDYLKTMIVVMVNKYAQSSKFGNVYDIVLKCQRFLEVVQFEYKM